MAEKQVKTHHRKLTPDEITARDAKRARAIRQKRRRRERAVAVTALLLTVYICIGAIIAIYGILSFNSVAENDKVYSIEGCLGDKKVFSVSASTANNAYGLYVSFTTLNRLCPISITGDANRIALILPDTDDYIECFSNSSSILVNDTPCRLSSPVLFTEDDWLIPVELLDNYVNGLTVTYGDNHVCKIVLADSSVVLTTSHSLPVGTANIEYSPLYNTDYIADTSEE
ncbi:MAG: hypothetical protein ACI3W9_04140 [Eubacteriales bacterium]